MLAGVAQDTSSGERSNLSEKSEFGKPGQPVLAIAVVIMVVTTITAVRPIFAAGGWASSPVINSDTSQILTAQTEAIVNTVLTTPVGPDDFAAVGDAVIAFNELLELQDSLGSQLQDVNAGAVFRRQSNTALQHLFPFLSANYQHAVTNSQRHDHSSKGLVIPCGNTDFQFALQLITAGIKLLPQLMHRCTCVSVAHAK